MKKPKRSSLTQLGVGPLDGVCHAPHSRLSSAGDPLVPLHTLYSRTYIVRGTSWYQPEIPVPT